MKFSLRLYVAIVVASAALIFGAVLWSIPVPVSANDLIGLTSLIALAFFAEALAIEFVLGPNRSGSNSVAFIPLFACMILFPVPLALAATAILQSLTQIAGKRRNLWKASFNVAQMVVAAAVAILVFHLLGGSPGITSHADFVAFAGLALSFFAVNFFLVSAFFSVAHEESFGRTVVQLAGAGAANLLYDLLASPVAIVVALLYGEYWIGGLFIVLLPIILIRYSYISKLQLERANRDLLQALVKAIETRDPYTSGHSLRVSKLARAIAEDLGLGSKAVARIEMTALLHDIGKIDSKYASLIRKPGGLTDEERRVIRTHAANGAEMLRSLSSVTDDVVAGVRHHHEHFDGSGYPDGLRGNSIPLAARIIMLCDSIDAMLSDRPYRRALTIAEVREEILRCSGTQFDPDIVRIVLQQNTLERAAGLVVEFAPVGEAAARTLQLA